MEKQKLHRLLETLHTELECDQPIDRENRELLLDVLADIRHVLERHPEEPTQEHHGLIDRLRDATRHLEESHPHLTSAAQQLVEALGRVFQ